MPLDEKTKVAQDENGGGVLLCMLCVAVHAKQGEMVMKFNENNK